MRDLLPALLISVGGFDLGLLPYVILDQFMSMVFLVLHFCVTVDIIRTGSDLKVSEGIRIVVSR